MKSGLYLGRVRHRRSEPVPHAFELPLFMVYLDLSELPAVFAGRWLWSARKRAFARFDRRDHLGDPAQPLDESIRDLVESRIGRRPTGPIRLLTNLRYGGYVFNPVSFYYCFTEDGALDAVVADVTNTPWNERHCYVLEHARGSRSFTDWAAKDFHVSPFFGMEMDYRFEFGLPGDRLRVRIESHARRGGRVFEADLELDRREITTRSLAHALLRNPLPTARLTAAIYWQALRLWCAGVPFHSHPRSRAQAQAHAHSIRVPEALGPDWRRPRE